MATVDLEKVVERFVQIRDAKKALEERHKSELVPYVAAMDKLEAFLRGVLKENKTLSMRTGAGTFFIKTVTSITVANKDTYLDWVKENGEWELADVRAAKTNVITYMNTPTGEPPDADGVVPTKGLPPGLNYTAIEEAQVRRS